MMFLKSAWMQGKERRIWNQEEHIKNLRFVLSSNISQELLAHIENELVDSERLLSDLESETYEEAKADYQFDEAKARRKGEW